MTNKYGNWERLERVIDWSNMSTHSFAMHIGLTRSENLYHIKKGNYGISHDLADRIVAHFPEIDRTWLLTGVGNMLKSHKDNGEHIPFYPQEIEQILPEMALIEPAGYIYIPFLNGCDVVVRSLSRAMCETSCAATELFIKRVEIDEVVQGNEYVLLVNNKVYWRKVRLVPGDESQWRLVARNREDFDDIFIDRGDVVQAWRVISRMAILES